MADLYLTPAERYTAALGGFYYGDLPEPGTVYTQLIKDILNGATPDKEPKNILARFIYSLYISDLGDTYPRYELAKLLYWKLHDITPTKSGSILTVTIDGKEDYMTINTDLSRLWYKVLFGSKTDVITDFPYIFNTMQNKLSDWELFGNVAVSGTPTPDNPIMPQGTGERTGNLLSPTANADVVYNASIGATVSSTVGSLPCSFNNDTITFSPSTVWTYTAFMTECISGNMYTFSCTTIGTGIRMSIYAVDNDYKVVRLIKNISGEKYVEETTTIGTNEKYIVVSVTAVTTDTVGLTEPMLNTGSTALPYEPFGYKIPISSAGTTTPVYLGEVETTRKINKFVLTGEENIDYSKLGVNSRFTISNAFRTADYHIGICSHYKYEFVNANNTVYHTSNNMASAIFIFDNSYTSAADFKAYLAAQYAAGTPVTVWYVLAEPETAVVNEPLMKIGEYADSLSRAQTGIDIPTVIGQNTLDVLTTVKPSSMRIEYTSADETRSRSKRISLLKKPLVKSIKQ
jgi:hypothetical protein